MRFCAASLASAWVAPALVASLTLAGCGAARPAPSSPSSPSAGPERVAGMELLLVRRPLGETTALALWIDAGSLDGAPASTALVAAELAAGAAVARSGRAVASVVLPDGTSLRLACPRSELADCVGDLAAGLSLRDVEPSAFEGALQRVRERRERGTGAARRTAETLAASAALGVPLSPLGDAEDVVRAEDVRAYLSAHFGASRALLVVVGDVTRETLAPHLDALARVRASESRRARSTTDGAQLASEEGADRPVLSLAVRTQDEPAALGLARAWSRRGALVGGVSTSAFPTRAGWLALVTIDPSMIDPSLVAGWLRAPAGTGERIVDEDAWSIADREGARWAAGPSEPRAWRAGAGWVGPLPEQVASDLRAALVDGERGEPPLRVPMSDVADVAAAWGVEGPASEGAAMHGATAIAARILARRCAGEAEVSVEADAVVVALRSEVSRVLSEASFWRDCVRAAPPSGAEIEEARRVEMALRTRDDTRRTWVAERSLPASPGAIAPLAAASVIAHVDADDVRARWATWGARSRLALAGSPALLGEPGPAIAEPAPPPRAAGLVAQPAAPARRRLAGLEVPEVVLSAILPDCGSAGAARRLLAEWARAVRATGARLVWADAGAGGGLAWLALSAQGSEEALARVAATPLAPEAGAEVAASGAHDELVDASLSRADPRRVAHDAAVAAIRGTEPSLARCVAPPVVQIGWLDPEPISGPRSGPRGR